ncbi:MAG: hypothetical protein IKN55_04465 [Oscillospiraceae bacterium]|nr:hypothetical protein [Oscillospiraceae bacterium]
MTTSKPYFPILEAEMAKHGISEEAISKHIGITERAFHNKISGKTDFWWNEVLAIHAVFPDVEPEKLFSHSADTVSVLVQGDETRNTSI